jgi:Lrp/AsnC family leucine-responsive transcriptional regulator
MAASAIHERVKKLEARGLIRGYEARLDPAPFGRKLLAFIFVRVDELPGEEDTGVRLAEIPEVLEVHHVAGEDCYLAKVRCADTDDLARLLRDRFGTIPTVRSTRTTIALGTLKETGRLPIGAPAIGAPAIETAEVRRG